MCITYLRSLPQTLNWFKMSKSGSTSTGTLHLGLDDTGVINSNVIVNAGVINSNVMALMDELDEEEASLLEDSDVKVFVGKSVSCQTDFDDYVSCSIPLVFCGLLSNECEAFTQCDIPKKVNIGIGCNILPSVIQKDCGSIDGFPVKISVPMKKLNSDSPFVRKEGVYPNEDIVFKPKGTKPPLVVPPASIRTETKEEVTAFNGE